MKLIEDIQNFMIWEAVDKIGDFSCHEIGQKSFSWKKYEKKHEFCIHFV